MKHPVIGLTPSLSGEPAVVQVRLNYAQAVRQAGGVPVLLPPCGGEELCALAALCDGFLFTGGVDLHPARYGEEPLAACGEISPERDAMELSLLRLALEQDKPVLGICRGIQLINVGLGGTLWQDLPSQTGTALCHSQRPPYGMPIHSVQIEEGSPLYRLIGERTHRVNSTHHQAVRDPAPSLQVAARAPDGVIEAVWRPQSRFLLGVQWHPEYLYPSDEGAAALFAALVSACRPG